MDPLKLDSELRDRAAQVIPGGMYGHQSVRSLPPGFPQFLDSGLGARVRDVDGNEYVDLMCSFGPVIVGHRHPRVEEAVRRQSALGDCLNGPSPRMVELAEALTERVAHAKWAILAKNGTDATTLCVTIARAATGRRKVLVARGAYHGAAPWCTPVRAGVTSEDRANLAYFDYNDLASAEAAADALAGDLAAVVVTPIRHDLGIDLELPRPEFARGLRALCDRTGAVLVLDDVRCGLRLHNGGSWEPLAVQPDLSAWSKAIANGYPLAAVLGRESLREAAASVYTTGSFWFAAVPMAASLATLEILSEEDTVGRMIKTGTRLRHGLQEQAAAHGLDVTLSGPPQLPFLTFAGDADFRLANVFAGAAVSGGVWLHPRHNWFVSGALTDQDLTRVLEVTDQAFAQVKELQNSR